MIINYEKTINAINASINEFTSSNDYKGNKLWENIVCGMSKTLCILEDVKQKSSYREALSGLKKDDLNNIRECIDGKILDIEKEERTTIHRLSVGNICYHFPSAVAAKNWLLMNYDELIVDNSDVLSVEFDQIAVPKSELSAYHLIE